MSSKADQATDNDANILNDLYNPRVDQGKLKHSFILAFYFLHRLAKIDLSNTDLLKAFYKKAIKETIQLGGDTDTNACIVGGMVGAALGITNIDVAMLRTLLTFDCVSDGQTSPKFLSV